MSGMFAGSRQVCMLKSVRIGRPAPFATLSPYMFGLETKARGLRQQASPSMEQLEKHANERDAFIAESIKLHYPVRDFASISALPGPRRWYEEPQR